MIDTRRVADTAAQVLALFGPVVRTVRMDFADPAELVVTFVAPDDRETGVRIRAERGWDRTQVVPPPAGWSATVFWTSLDTPARLRAREVQAGVELGHMLAGALVPGL